MNEDFESLLNVQPLGKARSPFSRFRRTPIMPGTLWETKARFERMRKYLYKYQDECRYIFPQNDFEKLIVEKSSELIGSMINILTDVLQQKKA